MAYGDYSGPDKPNKGKEGGACNRQRCQAEPALWYNHGSYAWYCGDCAADIGLDPVNKRDWDLRWKPDCGHDQFETRLMIDEREAKKTVAIDRDLISNPSVTIGRNAKLFIDDELHPISRMSSPLREIMEGTIEVEMTGTVKPTPGLTNRWNWYLSRRIGGRWWELSDRELRKLARQLSHRRVL